MKLLSIINRIKFYTNADESNYTTTAVKWMSNEFLQIVNRSHSNKDTKGQKAGYHLYKFLLE